MNLKKFIWSLSLLLVFTACKDRETEAEVPLEDELETETLEQEYPYPENDQLVTAIEADPELSTFGVALNAWNVEDRIQTLEGPLTIFAPSNAGYSGLNQEHGQQLIELNSEEIVEYHVVRSGFTMDELKQQIQQSQDSLKLETLSGEQLAVTMDGNTVTLHGATGDKANITSSFEAGEGQVFVIDQVLLPEDVRNRITLTAEE